MKPRIFIGSSTEHLDLAYAIQQNLDYDADTTVWTQGVFKLSQNTIDSLISTMNQSDFAIFIFHPDDATQIREKKFITVRDNLIFELGLFMGKLGKERVFFLVPRTIDSLHLPTDLLGITPGTYDNSRSDGNLQAAIGSFCNEIRESIKNFVIENIEDIQDEPDHIKKIVLEKPRGWELFFIAELLKTRLIPIEKAYQELTSNLLIQKVNLYTGRSFWEWYKTAIANIDNMRPVFANCIEELQKSVGKPGEPGKPIEMKNAVDRLFQLCKELLNWEYELYGIKPPDELLDVKEIMKNVTKETYIDLVAKLVELTESSLRNLNKDENVVNVSLTLDLPERLHQIVPIFSKYFEKYGWD